jgi:hypothetical protein
MPPQKNRILLGKGVNEMIGKKTIGLMVVLALLVVSAAPVVAAGKTFQLNIPGCTA